MSFCVNTASAKAPLKTKRKGKTRSGQLLDKQCRALGKELHDGVCQELAAASFYAKCLTSYLEKGDVEQATIFAQKLSGLINRAVVQTHGLANRLFHRSPD